MSDLINAVSLMFLNRYMSICFGFKKAHNNDHKAPLHIHPQVASAR